MPQPISPSVTPSGPVSVAALGGGRCRPGLLRAGLLWACVVWLGGQVLPGSILREVFQGIGGSSVGDLTNSPAFPSKPSSTNFVSDFFEAPTDVDASPDANSAMPKNTATVEPRASEMPA